MSLEVLSAHFTVRLKQHWSAKETSSVSTLGSGNCDSLTWVFKIWPAHQPRGHRAERSPQSLLLRLPDTQHPLVWVLTLSSELLALLARAWNPRSEGHRTRGWPLPVVSFC